MMPSTFVALLEGATITGYRSLDFVHSEEEARQRIDEAASEPFKESYWSHDDLDYYGRRHNSTCQITAEFDLNDPRLGGFGDSSYFCSYIVGMTDEIFDMPDDLLSEVNALRNTMMSAMEDDWSFVGCIPDKYRIAAAKLFMKIRSVVPFHVVADEGEFNYIGDYRPFITSLEIREPKPG